MDREDPSRTNEEARAALCARLRCRREEMEAVIVTRSDAGAEPSGASQAEYARDLRASFTASLDYGLAAIESGETRSLPLPASVATQARSAARRSVGLDAVLRRYVTGHTLLMEFAIAEAETGDLMGGIRWGELLRGQSVRFDRLIAEVSSIYMDEASACMASVEQRRAEKVRRLLSGESLDASGLGYDFDGWHVAAIASGPEAASSIRKMSRSLNCRLLLVQSEAETVWAWFGSSRPGDVAEFERSGRSVCSSQLLIALGEPAQGPAGWRLTHRQSSAALSVALRGARSPVRYVDIALVASMLSDDLLVTSLRENYLAPLEQERDDGKVMLGTLRTYFATDRNVSSAAAALGVTRRTVSNRLRKVEERLGRPLPSVAADVEAALRLQTFE